jgi:predicted AAA+ superfamily ATPase
LNSFLEEKESMLKRKMERVLERWKENNAHHPKALCLFGARQTGKSTLARVFGAKRYEQVIEINLIFDPDAKRIFENANGAKEILRNITSYTHKTVIPGQTLIILDEIQECPEARTMIKALVEDNTCEYIETGSLLDVRFKEIRSYPVGFEQIEFMYPLDLEEFL